MTTQEQGKIEQKLNSKNMFKCNRFNTRMLMSSCIARQKDTCQKGISGKSPLTQDQMAACKNCEQGKSIAEAIGIKFQIPTNPVIKKKRKQRVKTKKKVCELCKRELFMDKFSENRVKKCKECVTATRVKKVCIVCKKELRLSEFSEYRMKICAECKSRMDGNGDSGSGGGHQGQQQSGGPPPF